MFLLGQLGEKQKSKIKFFAALQYQKTVLKSVLLPTNLAYNGKLPGTLSYNTINYYTFENYVIKIYLLNINII